MAAILLDDTYQNVSSGTATMQVFATAAENKELALLYPELANETTAGSVAYVVSATQPSATEVGKVLYHLDELEVLSDVKIWMKNNDKSAIAVVVFNG